MKAGRRDPVEGGTEMGGGEGRVLPQLRPCPCLEQFHDVVQSRENSSSSGSSSLLHLSLGGRGTLQLSCLGRTSNQFQQWGSNCCAGDSGRELSKAMLI